MDIILPSCSKNLARAGQSALSHPFTIEARAEILNEIIQLHVEGTGQGGGRSGRWGGVFAKGRGLRNLGLQDLALSFKGSLGVLCSIQFRALGPPTLPSSLFRPPLTAIVPGEISSCLKPWSPVRKTALLWQLGS